MADSGINDDEFLADLAEMIEYYHNAGDDGAALAAVVVRQVRERWAGEEVYIKKGRGRHPCAEQIALEFDGTNAAEIMARYNVGRTTIYRYARHNKK